MGSDGIFMRIFWFCSSSSTPPFLIPLLISAGPRAPSVEVSLCDTYILLPLHLLVADVYWRNIGSVFGCSALFGGCLDSFIFLPEVIYSGARP